MAGVTGCPAEELDVWFSTLSVTKSWWKHYERALILLPYVSQTRNRWLVSLQGKEAAPPGRKAECDQRTLRWHLTNIVMLSWWRCHNHYPWARGNEDTHTLLHETHTCQLRWPAGGAEVTSKAPLGAPRAQIHTLLHSNLRQRQLIVWLLKFHSRQFQNHPLRGKKL